MAYTIWDEMRRMQEHMDTLFADFFAQEPWGSRSSGFLPGPSTGISTNLRQPLADLCEKENEYVAHVELPGVEKKDIQLHATEDGVEIKVEKKHELEQKEDDNGMTKLERSYAGFYRYISTPGAKPDEIEAELKNGVLELRIPKSESKHKGRLIEVK